MTMLCSDVESFGCFSVLVCDLGNRKGNGKGEI